LDFQSIHQSWQQTDWLEGENMKTAGFLLVFFNYALIMSLPFLFFENRDGRRCPMWWVTALPFLVLPVVVGLHGQAWIPPIAPTAGVSGGVLAIAATLTSVLSIVLVASALRAHGARAPQWHQEHDLPAAIVTRGPYSRVRHPFYLAYLLMFSAIFVLAPNAGTISVLVYAMLALNYTAAREEQRLSNSKLGSQYRAYVEQSGRFLPRLGAVG
jgi:protein-S-isoprenylcysteine O-methyltransferase Ste14